MVQSFHVSAVLSLCGWFAIAATPVVWAQTNERNTPSVKHNPADIDTARAIRDLASEMFGKRQAAFEKLVSNEDVAIGALEEAANTDDLEMATRCTAALVKIAGNKKYFSAAVAALERLAAESSNKNARLAASQVRELKMTDQKRAMRALAAAGVEVQLSPEGHVFSVQVSRDREIALLRHFPKLRTVDLVGAGVTDAGMTLLTRLTHLRDLSLLQTSSVTEAGFASLALAGANLKELTLIQTPFADSGLAQVGRIASLETLSITNAHVSDDGLMQLKDLHRLRSLSLRDTTVTEEGVTRLLAKHPTLKSVSVARGSEKPRRFRVPSPIRYSVSPVTGRRNAHLESSLTDQFAKELKSEPQLGMVYLATYAATDDHLARLADIPMTGLSARSNKISDRGISSLQDHATLSTLDVSSTRITDDCLDSIVRMPVLTSLSISDASVTDEGIRRLIKSCASQKNLKGLGLSGCPKLTDDALSRINDLHSLQRLSLSTDGLTTEILEYVGRLTELESLHLNSIPVDDADLLHLKSLKLDRLSLSHSQITDQGVEAIVAAFPGLTYLGLRGADVTDKAMASVGTLTELEFLRLDRTQVGEAGLAKLDSLKKLKFVFADKSAVSEHGKQRFKRAHPQTYLSLQD